MATIVAVPKRISNPAPGAPVRATKRLSEAQKARFLEALAQTGVLAEAARQASPHTKTGGLRTYKRAIEADPIFAAQVAEALDTANAAIVIEARRRALEGDLQAVIQRGEQAVLADGSPAFIRRYSDSLLLRLLNHVPGFEPVSKIEHTGTVRHENAMVIDLDQLILLDQSDRDALRRIMLKLAHGDNDLKQIAAPVIDTDFEVIEPEPWELVQ